MGVLPIISVMFAEILAISIGLVAFFFLFREYLSRKKTLLLWGGLYFLAFAAAFGTLFFGQILTAYTTGPIPEALTYAPNIFFPLASLFLFWFLIELLEGPSRRLLKGAATVVVAISLIAAWQGSKKIILINGLAVSEFDEKWFLLIFGSWFLAIILFYFVSRVLMYRSKRLGLPHQADEALLHSGAFGLLFLVSSVAAVLLRLEFIFLLNPLLIVLHLVFFFFGAVAKNNPDPAVERRPLNFISRRLILKAAVLNVMLFWGLIFTLMAITSNYFLESQSLAREASRRRDLHYLTKSYSSFSITLLEETMRLAGLSSVAQLARSGGTTMPADVLEIINKRGGDRIFRIIDSKGVVIYSSYSPDEIGTNMLSSAVVSKALQGIKVAAAESDPAYSRWMVRAAAPIVGDKEGHVLVSTGLEPVFDLADYSGIDAGGYGFVSEQGEPIYSIGSPLDGITRLFFKKSLSKAIISGGITDDGTAFNTERVFATDGTPDGFFYIYLERSRIDLEIVRILTVVTLLTILALILITTVLIFSISLVLRPIKELAAAAGEIEREKYDVNVGYESADELGALARAINRMARTIGERTANLKTALETQRNFLEHTAHEMRTPLNIFRWTLELLRFGDAGRLNKEQMELLEQLHQTNDRLLTMVENLRIASRLEQSGIILKRSFFPLEELADEAAGLMAVKMREKNIALHWQHPEQSLPKVFADRDRIMQILLNLLTNAAKYTQRGGHVEISMHSLEETTSSGAKGKFVQVSVEDNGMGIPKGEQHRVFSRFFRSSTVQKTEIEGTGLGLYISKELIDLHGGRIWFASEEGSGSTFHFTVPVEKTYDGNHKPE